MKYWTAFFLLLSSLSARESFDEYAHTASQPNDLEPWFTGPLLTPSGHVIPEGHFNFEPYIYWTQTSSKYNKHWKAHSFPLFNNILYQIAMQFGVLPNIEFDITPQFLYNQTKGAHTWRISDFPLTLAFQILKDRQNSWYPAIKLRFAANLPLGKHDHLNPLRLGTDVGGVGSWFPSVGLVFTRLHHITPRHPLAWRLFFNYSIGTPVQVKGASSYGGIPSQKGLAGTNGFVYPGNLFLTLAGFEYSLTQRWALALDLQYEHQNKRRFSGYSPKRTKPKAPSKELFAIAPALEYSWSPDIGAIAGPWFSVAGRNVDKFVSYVVAVNIYR